MKSSPHAPFAKDGFSARRTPGPFRRSMELQGSGSKNGVRTPNTTHDAASLVRDLFGVPFLSDL